MALRIGFKSRELLHKAANRAFRTSAGNLKIVQFVLSDIGEGIKEVTVRDWFVKVGDRVRQFDDVCLVESDKAAVNITSRFDGVVTRIYHEEGSLALVGQPLVDIDAEGLEDNEAADPSPTSDPVLSSENKTQATAAKTVKIDPSANELDSCDSHLYDVDSAEHKSMATPAVRRIAKEHKVSLTEIKGSGKNGRVMKEDILNYLNNKTLSGGSVSARPDANLTSASRQNRGDAGGDKTVPLIGIKKAMAKAMTESNLIPSFGYSDELDVTRLVSLRKEIKSQIQSEGKNITYMPFFIKALSNALASFPEVNAHVDGKCENMIIKSEHNVGFAVDTPNGLLVPNIKCVQKLSLLEISAELNRLIQKSKERALSIQDLSGGTITISNIGIIGGTYVRPLINPPEVAIVGMGRFRKRPVFDSNDQVVAAYTCNASWSADHRVIDGATLARFSELWKLYIENPLKLLLDA